MLYPLLLASEKWDSQSLVLPIHFAKTDRIVKVSNVNEALWGRIAPDDSSWRGLVGAIAGGKNGVRAGMEMMGSTLK